MRTVAALVVPRVLILDPSGRWTALLRAELAGSPGELVAWRPADQPQPDQQLSAAQLDNLLHRPGKPVQLVLFHCSSNSLWFLPLWQAAGKHRRLPPLVGLLDSPDEESATLLRQFGCARVYAGFHSLEPLVKTVKSLVATPVYPDLPLESLVTANLPWSE